MTTEQTENKPIFRAADIGCYVDGAAGELRRRQYLTTMMFHFSAKCIRQAQDLDGTDYQAERALRDRAASIDLVAFHLEAKPSDDYSEEQDAIDILQDHTADGLLWTMEAGDLILTSHTDDA